MLGMKPSVDQENDRRDGPSVVFLCDEMGRGPEVALV